MTTAPTPLSQMTLAVLAGGAGSRMGRPKGELWVGGEPILRHLLGRFAWPGPTLLVTAPGREHPPGWESFTQEAVDPVAGEGPLRGVLTALEAARTDNVLVTPVDMPGLAAGQLRWVASAFWSERCRRAGILGMMTSRSAPSGHEDGDGAMPQQIAPFPAMLHRDAAPLVRARLESGPRSVHALADGPGFLVVAAPESWGEETWVNLNRPGDLQAFLATEWENH